MKKSNFIEFSKQKFPLKYCKVCGKPILLSQTDEHGGASNIEYEINNGVHTSCSRIYESRIQEGNEKIIKQELEKQKQLEDKKFEDFVKNFKGGGNT